MNESKAAQSVGVGDVVEWRSQAGGHWKRKQGKVVAVVPGFVHPAFKLPDTTFFGDFGGLAREHESFLVQVGDSKNLYWPRVSALRIPARTGAGAA